MNPGDKAGSWPFRYSSHAVAVGMLDKSSVWYRMFHHRFRTILGYWAPTSKSKQHTSLFRNQNVSKSYQTPKAEHALQRADLVLFYEGALDYVLAHLDDVVKALEVSLRDQRSAVMASDQHADRARSLETALEKRDAEIETLRWTLGQVAKANKPDPILEQW